MHDVIDRDITRAMLHAEKEAKQPSAGSMHGLRNLEKGDCLHDIGTFG